MVSSYVCGAENESGLWVVTLKYTPPLPGRLSPVSGSVTGGGLGMRPPSLM